jgi:hypothetical protein
MSMKEKEDAHLKKKLCQSARFIKNGQAVNALEAEKRMKELISGVSNR